MKKEYKCHGKGENFEEKKGIYIWSRYNFET